MVALAWIGGIFGYAFLAGVVWAVGYPRVPFDKSYTYTKTKSDIHLFGLALACLLWPLGVPFCLGLLWVGRQRQGVDKSVPS